MYKDNNNTKRNKKSLFIITNFQIKFRLETETKCMMDILLLIYIFIAFHVLLHRLCFEFCSLLSLQAQGLHVCVSGTSWATSIRGTWQQIGINNTHFTSPGTPFGPKANYPW